MKRRAALLREPLVQFIVVGAVIAAAYTQLPAGAPVPPESVIVVNKGQIDQLSDLFQRSWNRPPTDAELDGLVDSFIREEVLFRTGQSIGLDEEDAIVRRRVVQKMQFLLEPDPDQLVPTEEELAAHLEENQAAFQIEPMIALAQVFFGSERPDTDVDRAIDEALRALQDGADPQTLGDRTLLPQVVPFGPVELLSRQFGAAFATAAMALPTGEWSGPVRSPFGLHLVLVSEREPARDPDLQEIRERVIAHWRAARRDAVAEERFAALQDSYNVIREDREVAEASAQEISGGEAAAQSP